MSGWTRRATLSAAVLGVTGCAVSDPVVRGGTTAAPIGPPSLGPTQAASLRAEAELRAWFVAGGHEGLASVRSAHIVRLRSADPLLPGDEPDFEAPAVAAPVADGAAERAIAAHRASALEHCGVNQPLALFYSALSVSAADRGASGGGGEPTVFAPASVEAARALLLERYWALAYALERGSGALDPKSPEYAAVRARIPQVWESRDEVAALVPQPPAQKTSYDIGPVGNPAEALAAFAAQELAVLGAWGRLFAALPPTDAPDALDAMAAQGPRVRAWGGKLPVWPGFTG